MSPEAGLIRKLLQEGYCGLRTLPDGTIAGVRQMLFTTGLFVGLDWYGAKRRYCYEHQHDAIEALLTWDGVGDPPGPWIKEKPSDRLGPGALKTEDPHVDRHS